MLNAVANARKSPRLAGGTANPTPGQRAVRQRTLSDPGPANTGPAVRAPTPTAAQATAAARLSDEAQTNAAITAQRASATAADNQLLQRIEAVIAARQPAQATSAAHLSSQAQADPTNSARQSSTVTADDRLLQRIEAAIAARATAAAAPTTQPSVTDLTGTADLTNTVADIGILAERLASGMFLAATRPESIPTLLRSIAPRHHHTVSGYILNVAHNLGPGHTTPSLPNLLAAINTISRCAGQVYNADAYIALNAATDDIKFCQAKLRASVEPASLPLHEMALSRRILDGLTDPIDNAGCTIASLAAGYVRKAIKRADDTKLKGLAVRPTTYTPTHTSTYPTSTTVPQHPTPTTGTGGRSNNGNPRGAGRGNGKGAIAPRLPYFRSAALGRDTRIPTDANGANVPNACALCGKGLLPGTTGHRANACPADRNTQDNWVYAGIPAQ
jgi:hypothetical protein